MNNIFKNKKAIELTINFIVMIIIGLAVFSAGMKLTYELYNKASKQSLQLNAQTQDKIVSLLNDGSLVAIPFNEKTIHRDEKDIFGIGVLNTFGSAEDEFYLKIDCFKDTLYSDNIGLLYESMHKIPNNEKKVIKLQTVINKNADPGMYICNVCVSRNYKELLSLTCTATVDKSYLYNNRLQKIYIKVP